MCATPDGLAVPPPLLCAHPQPATVEVCLDGVHLACGWGEVVIGHRRSGYEIGHEQTCQLLRGVVADGVRAGCGAPGGIGSPLWRVSAALYAVVGAHRLDERGRCHACRRRGAQLVPWRVGRARCEVDRETGFWLRQREQFLASQAEHRWGLTQPSPPAAVGEASDAASTGGPGRADDTCRCLTPRDPRTRPTEPR
ncbi:MAG: hypothetical protein ACRDRH_20010 [Pseudonocardia sp.]